MPWSDAFDDPVPLPNGKKAATLEDAAQFIQRLPKADQQRPHWQLAVETLINTAEGCDLMFRARIAVMRALAHGKSLPAPEPQQNHCQVTART